MIASFAAKPKALAFGLFLLLCSCAAVPFGHPQSYAGHPIVTSGYFKLPDGSNLPYRLYPAEGEPRAIVLALHGYTDSRDGYETLAKVLNAHGIAVYAPDQSSFGATPNRGHWPGTDTLVDEARDIAIQLRAKYPDTKLFIAGESMGGAIAILLGASHNPPPVDGYIISAAAVWGGAALNPLYRDVLSLSATIVPAKRLTGQAAHVKASDNLAALIAFSEDPLTIHAPRLDNLAGLVRLMGKAQTACARFNQPALIMYGGKDQLIPPEATRACWHAIPQNAPVTLAFYPPDYHLITRDLERAVPDSDIVNYILRGITVTDAPSQATIFLSS